MAEGDHPSGPDTDRDPLEQLAEEFLERRRLGESVSISSFAAAHPEMSDRIRDLFPTLELMEHLKPGPASARTSDTSRMIAWTGTIERLGDFRVIREIGRGGMGVVYEAEQESLGRRVALKVLPGDATDSPVRMRRFLREAQAAARLHHTNIVPVFGVGQQDGLCYYAMQYIPGQAIDQVLAAMRESRNGDAARIEAKTSCVPVSTPELSAAEAAMMLRPAPGDPRYWQNVARLGVQVADALDHAHRQGTLHRDIKPGNLLLDRMGTVWITDFGLAKPADLDDLTRTGDVVGTLRYMAPEQFEGKADARSDVYALGLTLYELLALRPAFGDTSGRRWAGAAGHLEPPHLRKIDPTIPRDLETIVAKAIACQPEHRYATAGELAADLQCFLDDLPIRARRTSPVARAWRWCRRNRAIASLSAAALALLVAVAVVASVGYVRTNQALARESIERQQAEDERTRTKAEHDRAQANLRLATRAFEDIFEKVAIDPVTLVADDDQDEDNGDESPWPEDARQAIVTPKEASLLESLLRFYDQFAEQNQSDLKAQKETARAHRRVGDICRRLGQDTKAETAYRRAIAAYRVIVEASPADADLLPVLAATYNELGQLYRQTGRFGESHTAHEKALKTLESQPEKAAAAAESRFELARTYGYLSTAMPQRGSRPSHGRSWQRPSPGQARESTENNRRAREILKELIAQSPSTARYRLAMARVQRDWSVMAMFGEQRDEAPKARAAAIETLEKLAQDFPKNPEYLYELAETYAMPYPGRRGEPGQAATAAEQVRRAVEIGNQLVARHPAVPDYRAALARFHMRAGELARGAKSLAQAEENFSKAAALGRRLVEECPSVALYRFFLIRSLDQLSEVQNARSEPAKAQATLEEAVAVAESANALAASGTTRMMVAMQYASLARLYRAAGDKTRADAASAKASSLWGHHPPGEPGRPFFPPRRP